MAIFEKPVRLLMKDMVDALSLQLGQTFTRQQAIDWFNEHYRKIKTGTIRAHLSRQSTNAPSRIHYNAKPVEDDLFFQIDSSRFRLYDPSHDPAPIHPKSKPNGESPQIVPRNDAKNLSGPARARLFVKANASYLAPA